MQVVKKQSGWPLAGVSWRHILLLFIVFGTLAFILSMQAIAQNPGYHQFADTREFLGVLNFFGVVSNIPFLLVGVAGVIHCRENNLMSFHPAWLSFFAGVAIVSFGSGYYHWNPGSGALFWDRLPMTIGFIGLFVALLTEYVDVRLEKFLLLPALILGASSVLYWHWYDDLRFYIWIQLLPLLTIPLVTALFRPRYSHQWLLLVALACYFLAKVAEIYDGDIFIFTHHTLSGHTLKHLLAASSCFSIYVMLKLRKVS